jgi:branched-chain amino acid transport system permease protein
MVYALIALGYTMVYGVLGLINFAHGEVFMAGAFLAVTAIALLLPVGASAWVWAMLPLVFVLAMLGAAALGAVIERSAYRPLRGSPKLTMLISSIGVSFFLQNAVMLVYGSKEKAFPELLPPQAFALGDILFTWTQVLIFTVSTALMLGLRAFIRHTKLGKAMRATAEDRDAASLMGISPDRVVRATFVIGSALAAVGGTLFAMNYGSINFHDGYLAGLKAFTAAVFGGIGSVPGAMLGGVLLGVFEGFGAGYISSQWKDVFAFVLLIAVLLFKPSGMLGDDSKEKV